MRDLLIKNLVKIKLLVCLLQYGTVNTSTLTILKRKFMQKIGISMVFKFLYMLWNRLSAYELKKYIVIFVVLTAILLFSKNEFKSLAGGLMVMLSIKASLIGLKSIGTMLFKKNKKRFSRGNSILSKGKMQNKLSQYDTRLPFGDFKLPIDAEVKHCFIIGRPGTGKTNCLNQIIAEIGVDKLPAIIHDTKGDFVPKFYKEGTDLIFNPLDKRCVGWNIFNDMEKETDFNLFACSLIPEQLNSDPYWHEVPRKILTDILSYCWFKNKRTNKDLWITLSLPIHTLAEMLKEVGSSSYNDLTGSEKTGSILMSIVLSKCKIFQYMQLLDGDFSISKWIRDNSNNTIFLTNQANTKDTVKPILSLFIDVCASRILSLPDDRNKRLFFILDEFGSLARMNNIINLLTLSRSKGGSVFIGIQDVGNIEKIYGREHRQTIVNACGNSLIFAVEDPDTAEFLSKKIGEMEYYETTESKTSSIQGINSSTSKSTHEEKRKERAILPSEIQKLPDMVAYFKTAGIGMSITGFKYVEWQTYALGFEEVELLSLDKSTNSNDEIFQSINQSITT